MISFNRILYESCIGFEDASYVNLRVLNMVDATLIVTSVIFAILVIIASVYFVVYYQHPEDKNVALFPKIITVS